MALKFRAALGPPKASDVASRELTIEKTAAGGAVSSDTVPLAANAASVDFVVERNTHFKLTLVDIDGDGNRSAPSAAVEGDALDIFPPPPPDITGVEGLGEE
jgi:hypothetical protein